MNKILICILILISSACNAQDPPITLKHAPGDTAAAFKRKNYTLLTYITNNFPINGATEFWIVPKKEGETYELTATNSMVMNSKEGNKILVVPNKETFELSIKKDGKVIEKIEFKATELEEPTIGAYVMESSESIKTIPIKTDSINFILYQPNDKYRRIYPKDCQYTSDSLTISLLRGNNNLKTETTKNGIITLRNFRLQKGDKLIIKAFNVKRRNFRGMSFPVSNTIKKEYIIK